MYGRYRRYSSNKDTVQEGKRMINLKRWVALALSLCLLMTGFALAEETALTDVVSVPVEAAPMEEELALQPYAPEEDVAVSAAEAGDDLPKAAGVRIDSENFPDADFRDYVSDVYDLDMDGYLSQDEIDAATSLSIGYLSSIKGIRFLKKLEYVDLYQLDLGDESINLSGFASLKTLDVYRCMYGSLNLKGCSKLEAASLYRYGAPSGSVNLSGCAALERLNIGLNGAMKVDISDCPRLIKAVKKGKKTDAVYGKEWEDYRPVTFQYKDYTLYCDVEAGVFINGVNVTKPTSIKLNKTGTVKLKMTDTLKLKATMKPATALSGLTWKSSNKKIATVTQSGRVRPKKPGTATITVKTANGKSAKVKVKVVAVKPTKVKITKGSKATIYVGGKLTLKAKLYPTGATSKLTWKSSDKKVATVSSKGVVKAKKKGTATITVKTANGKKASCLVTVKRIGNEIPFPLYLWHETHNTATMLKVKKDWSFEGGYDDIEPPTFSFTGSFSSVAPVNDYCYKMKVKKFYPSISISWTLIGAESVWYLYKPGTPVSLLPQEVRLEYLWQDTLEEYVMFDATDNVVYKTAWKFD